MVPMSHFNRSVMNIGYHYHQGSTPTDPWIKNLSIVGIKDSQMTCDVIKTDFCYLPPSQLKILNFEAYL